MINDRIETPLSLLLFPCIYIAPTRNQSTLDEEARLYGTETPKAP